jgi:hypothetical protein
MVLSMGPSPCAILVPQAIIIQASMIGPGWLHPSRNFCPSGAGRVFLVVPINSLVVCSVCAQVSTCLSYLYVVQRRLTKCSQDCRRCRVRRAHHNSPRRARYEQRLSLPRNGTKRLIPEVSRRAFTSHYKFHPFAYAGCD